MHTIDWYGLYTVTWSRELMVPEAMEHPGRINPGLSRMIYNYLTTEELLPPCSIIADPMAGVAGTALHAMHMGHHWRGVEIEETNARLAAANLELWEKSREWWPNFGSGKICHGDGRRLSEYVPRAYAIISSPPYEDVLDGSGEGPGARYDFETHAPDNAVKRTSAPGYGRENGQLGVMRGEAFWAGAQEIVRESIHVLSPGGVAVWITGDYIRQGRRVQFGKQWRNLCLSEGLELHTHARAWKMGDGLLQGYLFQGEAKDNRSRHVSQFRRAANEKYPEEAVEHEDVWIFLKP